MTGKVMLYRRIIAFCVAMLIGLSSYAQGGFTINLKLVDAKTSEPVGFATVSLTRQGEKQAFKYVLSDSHGAAEITKVRKGTYDLRAEIMGYKTYHKAITLEKDLNLGVVKMEADVEALDAASVSAVGNPIVVKKDTIEYTASSFKTSDNDMLEQLLKKLPGVEVNTDGSITANGETIKKITIDGKTFFLDDPQLASKNIPAKIVEKVKVVEKKSDQTLFTGIDDGEEETIIDLSLRPGMMQGWFGNVMGGGGKDIPGKDSDMNDPRYQGAAMVGRFTEDSQLSIILNGNNTNNRGFNDMSGSMMQGMRGGRGMGRGQGGWGGNNGISTSWMGGLNGAFTLFDGDMDLAGNYLYSGSDNYVKEETHKTTYMQDGSHLLNHDIGTNNTSTYGNRFGIRLDHKFSENTSILFEPQFSFGGGGFMERSDFYTDSAMGTDTTHTNKGFINNTGDNSNWSTSGNLLFRQRLGKPGRTISASVRYSFNNNDLAGLNQSLTYVDENNDGKWDENPDKVNQFIEQNSKSSSMSGRMVYTEPLGNDFFMEANYEYGWNLSKSVKDAYNSGSYEMTSDEKGLIYDHVGSTPDETYSNDISNRYINQRAGLNFSYQKKKFRAQIGATINPTDTYNETNGEKYESHVVNWSPQAMMNYSISDNTHMRMFYFGRSSQPSTSQLMPVPDNSNPLNISLGNPYLKPYFNHNMRGMFGYTNKKTFTSVHARFGLSHVKDAITSAQWYDGNSKVQYSLPVNGTGNTSMDMRVMVNSPLGKSNFSIYSMTYARYNSSGAFIGKESMSGDKYYDKETAEFDYDLFNKDFPGIEELETAFTNNRTQTVSFTQRLRFTFRNDFVEFNLGGRTRMNRSWITIKNSNLQPTWNNQVDVSMNWTIPGGLNLIADADYNWYNGYTPAQEDEIVLNAEITKLLFKNKFTLALKAYDILGQSKNISVSDTSNNHLETWNNTLGRYVILSLTYRFGNFKGGGNRGPGGPGGPHHGHGGPPRR